MIHELIFSHADSGWLPLLKELYCSQEKGYPIVKEKNKKD